MSAIFTRGETVVTISSGYQYPFETNYQLGQAHLYTEGGTLVVQDLGTSREEQILLFARLTTTQKDNLKSFYHTTVVGAKETFTFTDADAANHTARWMDATFKPRMLYANRWELSITLRYE
jgi:hypothetical protein